MRDEFEQNQRALEAIEAGLRKARDVRERGSCHLSDDFTAWVITQELRRAGFSITPSTPPAAPKDPPPTLRVA
ncbi:MAG: hypothetical protein AAF224_00590 [Pseudomonadota bacterium]